MADLDITDGDIPRLDGKVVLITGGASGIGLALAKLLLARGCTVHVVDLQPPSADEDPEADEWDEWPRFHVHRADVCAWPALRAAFAAVFAAARRLDMCFANAGITELDPALADAYYLDDDVDGQAERGEEGAGSGSGSGDGDGAGDDVAGLKDPTGAYEVVDTNLRGVLNTVKLARYCMRKGGVGEGSIVITTSTAGYWPDPYAPIASATWGAQLNLIRALQPVLLKEGITINGVAPFVAISRLVPLDMGLVLVEQGVPCSEAKMVALALAYAATARQAPTRPGEEGSSSSVAGRWNGRVIHVVGDKYKEVEEALLAMRDDWFGEQHAGYIKKGQAITSAAADKLLEDGAAA